jgi:hypothetical protein
MGASQEQCVGQEQGAGLEQRVGSRTSGGRRGPESNGPVQQAALLRP